MTFVQRTGLQFNQLPHYSSVWPEVVVTTNQSPDTAILLERSEDYEICHGGQVYFGAKGGDQSGEGGMVEPR
jgi:hypothetical protein